MNEKTTKEVKTLPIITKFIMTIGELPTSYLMSMTYLEQVTWLCNYLEKTIIPALNQNGEAVKELQELYELLRTYVNEYFDNLDIQTEVNNKLDKMSESGELAEIIAQYLEVASVLGFDTKNSLKSADNLVNGSITKTIGENTYNDGKGTYYKIRTITSSDIIDNDNILALSNYPTLIAEKLPDYRMNQVENTINNLSDEIDLLTNKKCIFIGDSYAQGYTPTVTVTGWPNLIISKLGLQNSIIKSYGGTGFVNTVDNKNFITLLDEVEADNDVTDIIVCGGYNDTSHLSDIENGISSFKSIAITKFPNATIHIGAIGWSSDNSKFYNLSRVICQYIKTTKNLGLHYLNNVEYSLHEYGLCFASDGIHPNLYGQNTLADNIAHAFLYGSCEMNRPYSNIVAINKNSLTESISATLGCTLNNGIVEVSMQTGGNILFTSPQSFSGRSGINIRLFDFQLSDNKFSYIMGNSYNYNKGYAPIIIVTSDNKYYNAIGGFIFEGGSVYLDIKGLINDNHSNYISLNITSIQVLSGFTFSCNALMC